MKKMNFKGEYVIKSNEELYNLIWLRPSVYKGTTVIYDLELINSMLARESIVVADSLGMKYGDICSIKANVVCDGKRCGVTKLYLSSESLTDFISLYGTEHINTTFTAELEVVYGVYGSVDINDTEITGYKLVKIIENKE